MVIQINITEKPPVKYHRRLFSFFDQGPVYYPKRRLMVNEEKVNG